MKFTFDYNYETPSGEEITLQVEAEYHPTSCGHRDSLGAPEEPDEPAYIEILSVTFNGAEYDHPGFDDEMEAITREANNHYDQIEYDEEEF